MRTFTGLTDLNIQARLWLDTVANVRIHGTTHEVPLQRLQQEVLQKFNVRPFDEAERHARKVSADSLISYAANRYSVPWRYVGQTVEVQDERNGRLRIFLLGTSSSPNTTKPLGTMRWSSTASIPKASAPQSGSPSSCPCRA